jgi:hypothetical protein
MEMPNGLVLIFFGYRLLPKAAWNFLRSWIRDLGVASNWFPDIAYRRAVL